LRRLFPRCHRALIAIGYSEGAARQTLLAARRGDRLALVLVRVAADAQRSHIRDLLMILNDLM